MKTIKFFSMLTIFAGLILIQNPAHAQQTETLFDGNVSHGGFGGPVVKFSNVAESGAVWVGGRGGWIINLNENHGISLGGGGYGLATNHPASNPQIGDPDSDYYALTGYGGFEFEYTNRSYKLAHFTLSTLIGGGGLMLRERDYEEVEEEVDTYFVLEPGIHAELNVTTFFRISTGLSYRMTSGINKFGFTDSDFSGLNAIITFKFGGFL
ncbi:MAG: hypothetical protein JJU37_14940 [Balneolaceae bacterium]|nr:hypothetical protein [Balneolaceae bacterium]